MRILAKEKCVNTVTRSTAAFTEDIVSIEDTITSAHLCTMSDRQSTMKDRHLKRDANTSKTKKSSLNED